ncbi:hypothetical protein RTG_02001 [Rhodotorula toruloides ATCC 204091]|uniref:Uncharacterized protein n=1 Tax=Rhodotorula toruloides TaxID=5286 RepID=A0A0K3CNV7_RHOTO|nr:hypothetical protein RTG_02001 [Rhodotorula toruloides ATCC 204091]PRQ72434.1 hypothetical protein AAT19DRAFT_16358 [Rhodotorula toruloides]
MGEPSSEEKTTTTTHTLVELLRKVEIEEWDLRNALLALARQASPPMQVENLRQPLLKVVRQALFDHAMLLRLGKQTSIMYGPNIVALHDLTMVLKHAELVFGREKEPWLAELVARIIGLTYRMASRRTEELEIREQIEAIGQCRLWIQARIPESDLRREEILAELLEWLDQLEVSTKCLLQVRLMEQ